MATLPTTSLGNYSNLVTLTATGTNPLLEPIASVDWADYVEDTTNSSHTGTADFALGDMPSDFFSMSAASIRIGYNGSGFSNNTWSVSAQIFKSDLTTALTNNVTIASGLGNATQVTSSVVSLTGLDTAATQSEWNGAVVRISITVTKNKGGDGSMSARVAAAEVTGTYTQAAYLTPSRLDNSQTFYAPTAAPGTVTLSQGTRFDNSQTFYAGSVYFPDESGSTLWSASGNIWELYPGLWSDTFSAPQTLTPTLYSNSQTFYAPTVTAGTVTLTAARYDNSQTFYAATVSAGATTLTATRYDNSQTFYAATVAAGAVTLTPARYDNSQTFYSPTATAGAYTLTPARYDNSQAFYGPSVSTGPVTLLPTLYSNTQTFYAPTVAGGPVTLTATRYDNNQTFYGHVVTDLGVNLAPTRYDNSQTFYAPTVSAGPVTLTATRYDNSQAFYSHTVSSGAITLQPNRVDNSQTFYAPTVEVGAAVLSPLRYDNSQTFYAATVSVGPVTLSASLFTNSQSFYGPTIQQASDATLTASLFTNTNVIYPLEVIPPPSDLSAFTASGTPVTTGGLSYVGSPPILELIASANDATYLLDNTNSTHTLYADIPIDDMPSDFASMASLSVQLRYSAANLSNNTWTSLTARVYQSDLTTPLTDEATVASSIGNTAATNSSVVAFTGVQSGTKTAWDGAYVRISISVNKTKGGDGSMDLRVTAGQFTGKYNKTKTIAPGLFTNTNTFYAHLLEQAGLALFATRYDNSQTFYAPTVAPGEVTVTQASRHDNAQTFYSATVFAGTPQDLTPSLFTNSNTFYSATASPGQVTLQPGLLTNTTTFYSPTASPGVYGISPELFTNSNLFYGPTVAPGAVVITPPRLDNSQQFYGITVTTPGAIYPDVLVNDNTFYVHALNLSVESIVTPSPGNYSFLNPRQHYEKLAIRKRKRVTGKDAKQSVSKIADTLTNEAQRSGIPEARALNLIYEEMLNAELERRKAGLIDQAILDGLAFEAMLADAKRAKDLEAIAAAEAIKAAEDEERMIVQMLFEL